METISTPNRDPKNYVTEFMLETVATEWVSEHHFYLNQVFFFCRKEHEENFATIVNEMGKASAHVRVL